MAENIWLDIGTEFASKAVEHDMANDLKEAHDSYVQAWEAIEKGLKFEHDPHASAVFSDRAKDYINRAEELKRELKAVPPLPHAATGANAGLDVGDPAARVPPPLPPRPHRPAAPPGPSGGGIASTTGSSSPASASARGVAGDSGGRAFEPPPHPSRRRGATVSGAKPSKAPPPLPAPAAGAAAAATTASLAGRPGRPARITLSTKVSDPGPEVTNHHHGRSASTARQQLGLAGGAGAAGGSSRGQSGAATPEAAAGRSQGGFFGGSGDGFGGGRTCPSVREFSFDGPTEQSAMLGKGFFAATYRMKHAIDGRRYAVKLIRLAEARVAFSLCDTVEVSEDVTLHRILDEARTLAQLDHKHIVGYYTAFRHEPDGGPAQVALVMEYVSGGTLEDLILGGYFQQQQQQQQQQQVEPARIFGELLMALAYLHDEAGMIHRDVKPDNILITQPPRRHLKLGDFGFARIIKEHANDNIYHQQMGGHGQGAVPYRSPEECRGQDYDGKADVWAAGIILVEMILGKSIIEIFGTAPLAQATDKQRNKLLRWTDGGVLGRGVRHILTKIDPMGRPTASEMHEIMIAEWDQYHWRQEQQQQQQAAGGSAGQGVSAVDLSGAASPPSVPSVGIGVTARRRHPVPLTPADAARCRPPLPPSPLGQNPPRTFNHGALSMLGEQEAQAQPAVRPSSMQSRRPAPVATTAKPDGSETSSLSRLTPRTSNDGSESAQSSSSDARLTPKGQASPCSAVHTLTFSERTMTRLYVDSKEKILALLHEYKVDIQGLSSHPNSGEVQVVFSDVERRDEAQAFVRECLGKRGRRLSSDLRISSEDEDKKGKGRDAVGDTATTPSSSSNQGPREAVPSGHDLVGRRIRVYCPEDGAGPARWVNGAIVKYDPASALQPSKHYIHFDDGEKNWRFLGSTKHVLLAGSGQLPADKMTLSSAGALQEQQTRPRRHGSTGRGKSFGSRLDFRSVLRSRARSRKSKAKKDKEDDRHFSEEAPPALGEPSGAQFGAPLESLVAQHVGGYSRHIPRVLVTLYNELKANDGLTTLGIFRISPDRNAKDQCYGRLNKCKVEGVGQLPPDQFFDRCRPDAGVKLMNSPHIAAALIKVWLRELPTKLLDGADPEEITRLAETGSAVELGERLLKGRAGGKSPLLREPAWYVFVATVNVMLLVVVVANVS